MKSKIITTITIILMVIGIFSIKTSATSVIDENDIVNAINDIGNMNTVGTDEGYNHHEELWVTYNNDVKQVQRGQHIDMVFELTKISYSSEEWSPVVFEFQMEYEKSVFEKLNKSGLIFENGWKLDSFEETETATIYQYNFKVSRTTETAVQQGGSGFFRGGLNVKKNAKLGDTKLDLLNGFVTTKNGERISMNETGVDILKVVGPASKNPKTGIEDYTVPAIAVVSVLAILGYVRYRKII